MAVFLADRIVSGRKLLWFGIGLTAVLGLRTLVPDDAPAPTHPRHRCGAMKMKPCRFIGIGSDISDHGDAMARTIKETFTEVAGDGWTIAPHNAHAHVRSGFYITPRLERIDTVVERDPNLDNTMATFVTCNVSLEVAMYPHRYTIATVEASARVTASSQSDETELSIAHDACVTSAIEDAVVQAAPAIQNIAR